MNSIVFLDSSIYFEISSLLFGMMEAKMEKVGNGSQLSTRNASFFISPKHRILDSRFLCFKLISIAMLRGFGLMSWQNFWRLARDSSMSWEEMMALVHCAGNSVKGQNPLMYWQCCCNGQNPSNHL